MLCKKQYGASPIIPNHVSQNINAFISPRNVKENVLGDYETK